MFICSLRPWQILALLKDCLAHRLTRSPLRLFWVLQKWFSKVENILESLKTRLPPLPAPRLKEFRFLMSVVSVAPLSQLFGLLSQKLARCKSLSHQGTIKRDLYGQSKRTICASDLYERSACKIDEAYKLILSLPEVFYLSWIRKIGRLMNLLRRAKRHVLTRQIWILQSVLALSYREC